MQGSICQGDLGRILSLDGYIKEAEVPDTPEQP